jgi:hypothetical protein
MGTGDDRGLIRLRLWWARRLAHRRAIECAASDMLDRYGPAAFGIARNSARRGGEGYRRFWRQVARRLRGGEQMSEEQA